MEELAKLAKPLAEYLDNNFMNCMVVVTATEMRIMYNLETKPINEFMSQERIDKIKADTVAYIMADLRSRSDAHQANGDNAQEGQEQTDSLP